MREPSEGRREQQSQPISRGLTRNPSCSEKFLQRGWTRGSSPIGGRTLLDALHRSRDFHRELFRHVLGGLAACSPHHRTAVAPGGGVKRAEVNAEIGRGASRYCWLFEPRIESSGKVSPKAVPFLPAATPTS